MSRRQVFAAAAFGIAAPWSWARISSETGVGAVESRKSSKKNATLVNSEHYDLRRSGAMCDGSTDDTAAWTHAVSTVAASGGGKIWWRGTSVANQVKLSSGVGILGLGPEHSILAHKSGRLPGQHLVLLEEPDARNVSLEDLTIAGNRSRQNGLACGVYFDNTSGEGVLARHRIKNVHIRDVAGTGLFWGYQMRSSTVDGMVIYYCDQHGVHANVFSDNTMQNIDVGQSGHHGIYLANCFNSRFSNLKSWYSGRIEAGGVGIFQQHGGINVYSNILTQENSGAGLLVKGGKKPVTGVVVRGFNSDSDNAAGESKNSALIIDHVQNSNFSITVTSKAPLQAKPYSGVRIDGSSGNKVTASVDPEAVDWELTGNSIADNDVDLSRGIVDTKPEIKEISPLVYRHRMNNVTLRDDVVVNNPQTPRGSPPIGLRYSFTLIQDKQGGHQTGWGSAYKLPARYEMNVEPKTRTVVEFECAGDNDWIVKEFTTGVPV